ncbi:PA0069 family radical SAM protein [Pontibacter akesuensis]|uniref:DNA repair photolyase n=1 Tax=Pontibacter akesuensis TaxID=388950 RepID=A0A1I7FLA6_9BACT|nr:PA0069 family radical SAM protein [Pontibacter akesuensis]GHA61613.1 radical SAM protein [Pontibacter akesuensis]SFU36973.1 DNA repair photolyase [Pontibacter akesuensis]
MIKAEDFLKGRGAQYNPQNPYLKQEYVAEHVEGLDEPMLSNSITEFLQEHPKKVVNKIDSPDLGLVYSLNPYQGCEHGCVYCYARNTHQYWGYGAGLDFERKIIIKENAAQTLAKQLESPNWQVMPIMLAGNTDCYQPIEAKKMLTRQVLEVLLQYRHPVSIITKNALILRDLDLLQELNKYNLVHANISITTLNEALRQKLEPRTASAAKRLEVVRKLAAAGIPVNVMTAPIIPGLNDSEIPQLLKAAAEAGASNAAYTIVRLNGSIGPIFEDWIRQAFPDRADKVLSQIADCHGGQLNDSRFGVRMSGEGKFAEAIAKLFRMSKQKYMAGRSMKPYDYTHFCQRKGKQLDFF